MKASFSYFPKISRYEYKLLREMADRGAQQLTAFSASIVVWVFYPQHIQAAGPMVPT